MLWSPSQDARLAALKASRLPWEDIAARLGVTVEAAQCRARRLGLTRPPPPPRPTLAPLSPQDRERVELAVRRLRRRGHVVHAERVADHLVAETGRWVVGRRRVDLAGLIAAAERCR